MAGVFDSGLHVVMQVSFDIVSQLLLATLRDDRARSCAFGEGVWVDAVAFEPGNDRFIVIQRPPASSTSPFPPIPEAELRSRLVLDAPPLLNALALPFAAISQIRRRMLGAPLTTVSLGYETSIAPAPAPAAFNGFTDEFIRPPGGPARDWGIALSGEAMQAIVDRALGSGSAQIAFDPPGSAIAHVDLAIGQMQGVYGDPIVIAGTGTVVTDGDESTIDQFVATVRFAIDSQGELSLRIEVPVIDVDWTDNFWPFSSFDRDERAATAAAIRRVILDGFRDTFGRRGVATSQTDTILCQVVSQTGSGFLIGERLTQAADFFEITGAGRARLNREPALVVVDGQSQRLVDLGHPGSGDPGTPIDLVPPLSYACDGSGQPFPRRSLLLRNDGAGPLFVCGIQFSIGGGANRFQVGVYRQLPFTLAPGEGELIDVDYGGPAGTPGSGTLRITCNDPQNLIAFVRFRVLSGGTTFHVDPNPVDMAFANTPGGAPRYRLGHCRSIPARTEAGRFDVVNDGDNPLYLCGASLADPDNVFQVPFVPGIVAPHDHRTFGVLFFPTQAMRHYNATVTIDSSEGPIVVALHGIVQTLPQLGDRSDWVDLNVDEACIPADVLCRLRDIFEPIPGPRPGPGPDPLPVFRVSIDGVAPDSEVIFGDRGGTTHVRDYSGRPRREHALEYTPLPDGVPPDDPCALDIRGPRPTRIDSYRVSVSGRLIRPVAGLPGVDGVGPLVASGGWVYAATPRGIRVVDWRETGRPRRGVLLAIGEPRALAVTGGLLFAGTERALHVLDLRRPHRPVRRAVVKLVHGARALVASHGRLYVLDGDAITILEATKASWRSRGRIEVPGGARALVGVAGGLCAAGGARLTLLALDDRGRLRVQDTVTLAEPVDRLTRYGRDLVASGGFGSKLFGVEGGRELRPVAEYRRRHWSVAFTPDPERGRLFRPGKGGRIDLWLAEVHHIDRRRFRDALELRYRPERPGNRRGAPAGPLIPPRPRRAPPGGPGRARHRRR